MIVKYSRSFIAKLKKSDARIRKSFKQRIDIFLRNPYDLQLNNHELRDEWEGHRSIDITADWRAIYEEVKIGEEDPFAYFTALGTHKHLYR
jgi:addiction module RelE/StbE family toxin